MPPRCCFISFGPLRLRMVNTQKTSRRLEELGDWFTGSGDQIEPHRFEAMGVLQDGQEKSNSILMFGAKSRLLKSAHTRPNCRGMGRLDTYSRCRSTDVEDHEPQSAFPSITCVPWMRMGIGLEGLRGCKVPIQPGASEPTECRNKHTEPRAHENG